MDTNTKKWRVLIADDDEGTVEMLKFRFELAGFEVLTAFNGADAVARFKQATETNREIHFCVLDYEMPRMKGDVAATEILDLARSVNMIPPDVIIFTGSTDANLMLRLQTAEIGIALIKPQGLNQLEKIINRFEQANDQLSDNGVLKRRASEVSAVGHGIGEPIRENIGKPLDLFGRPAVDGAETETATKPLVHRFFQTTDERRAAA